MTAVRHARSLLHHDRTGTRRVLTAVSVVAALGVSSVAGIALSTAAAEPQWRTVTATSSDAFVETIGVNVHMGYTDTVYADRERVLRLLKDLGVRHVRDGVSHDNGPAVRGLRLLRDNGIQASLIVDPGGRHGAGTLAQQIDALTDPARLAGVAATIEGPNELDCSGDGWVERVRAQQADLARAVAAEPALRDLPLLGPSWCRYGSIKEYGADGGNSDAVNLHPYPGGRPPESQAGQFAHAREVNPGKPLYATEAGYHNAVNGDGGGHVPTSEKATAPYLLRTFLENHRLGVSRTFVYELQNQRPNPSLTNREVHFGLVRHDESRTPAYVALKNMIATLADPGATVGPRELRFGLSGAPDDTHTMAFARADGSTDLVIWRNVSVWDTAAKRDLSVAGTAVDVVLASPTSASLVTPVTGAQRTALGVATSFTVPVGAAPVILRLAGDGPAPQPGPAPSATPTVTATATTIPVTAPGSATSPTTAGSAVAPSAPAPGAPTGTVSATPAPCAAPAAGPTALVAPVPAHQLAVGDVLRIDAGATSAVRSGSRMWSPDEGFVGGTTGTARRPVAMTSYPEVYSTYRWGMSGFAIDVPDGDYRISLLMAEDAFGAIGQRVFTVSAEGRPVLSGMDLFATAGMHTGVWRSFRTTVTDGRLDLGFCADVDNAILAGMQIRRST